MNIVQIAWGKTPDDETLVPKDDALRRVAEADEVQAYEPGLSIQELFAAFGHGDDSPYDSPYDSRFKWYQFTSPKGDVLCVSRNGETYWVQDGPSLQIRWP